MNTRTAIGIWSVREFQGRPGLLQLEPDWRRLYATMPRRSCFHPFELQLAYVDYVMEDPSQLRCLALDDDCGIRAICLLEPKTDRTPRFPLRVWCIPFLPHTRIRDVICADDEVRREVIPVLVEYLRRKPQGRAVLHLGSMYSDSPLWEGATSVKLVYEALRSIRFSDTQLAMSCGATSSGS